MARSSKASPALAAPLRTIAPRTWVTGSDSPVSADSSTVACALCTAPSTGTSSPARTSTTSPTASRPTGTSSQPSPPRRWAMLGIRSSSAVSSRRARRDAIASSALPPESISAITAPARYWPIASAPAIAIRAIASTPTRPRARVRDDRHGQRDQHHGDGRRPDRVARRRRPEQVQRAAGGDQDQGQEGQQAKASVGREETSHHPMITTGRRLHAAAPRTRHDSGSSPTTPHRACCSPARTGRG